ncbi:hypothetical protein F5Y14DRAFT_45574 [Nemania sp. NC0429]|nr:hypothetical protein F5Y14DRAFT_45574 [Nemania sp. NC0429]
MPPKRSPTGLSRPIRKKANAAATAAPAAAVAAAAVAAAKPAESEYKPPRSDRWSDLSGSANVEADYRMVWEDKERAYSYITLCSAFYVDAEEDEEDGESDDSDDSGGCSRGRKKSGEKEEEGQGEKEDEEDDDTKRLGPRCAKKPCYCFKPVASDSNPEHPWVVSWAGIKKFSTQFIHLYLRNPDYFQIYTFNDHAAYGSLEVLQNLFLDFEDGEKDWREQWAVCEAAIHWILHPRSGIIYWMDDHKAVAETMALFGRMFLAMLARLDRLGLVGDNTAVKSLGCTMAMYFIHDIDLDPSDLISDDGPEKYVSRKRKVQTDQLGDIIVSYAEQRGVTLCGPSNIDVLVAEADGDIELPKKNAKDPWGWKAALERYRGIFGISGANTGTGRIGGDYYDITAMSPAQRKCASFTGKDPLTRNDINALKKGMVLDPR